MKTVLIRTGLALLLGVLAGHFLWPTAKNTESWFAAKPNFQIQYKDAPSAKIDKWETSINGTIPLDQGLSLHLQLVADGITDMDVMQGDAALGSFVPHANWNWSGEAIEVRIIEEGGSTQTFFLKLIPKADKAVIQYTAPTQSK